MAADKRKNDGDIMLEKVSGSVWVGVLGAFVCLHAEIYVNMGYAK